MFKHSRMVLAVAVTIFSAQAMWSQDATAKKDDAAKQEEPSTSVAPATVEITPATLDAHVGEKVKFSATAKDASGNAIDAKPSVWFAAPFDLAGADENGEVTFHGPGVGGSSKPSQHSINRSKTLSRGANHPRPGRIHPIRNAKPGQCQRNSKCVPLLNQV